MKKKNILLLISITLIMLFSYLVFTNIDFFKLKGEANYTNSYKNEYINITQNNGSDFNENKLNFTTYSDDIKLITITINKPVNEPLDTVEITLKEGINFITYPVKPRENDTIYPEVEKMILEEDSLYGVIDFSDSTNVTKQIRNNMPTNTNYEKSTFGTLSYNIKSGIEEVVIPINIGIDFFKYYYNEPNIPFEIKDALKIRINGKDEYDLDIDFEINNPVKNNSTIYKVTIDKPGSNAYTKDLFYSTEDSISYGYTKTARYLVNNGRQAMNFMPEFKYAEYILYYPKFTEFVDITDESNKSYTNLDNNNSTSQILIRHGLYDNQYCEIVSSTYYEQNKNKDEAYCYVVDYNNNANDNPNYVKVYVSKYTNTLSEGIAVKYKVLTEDKIKEINKDIDFPLKWVSEQEDTLKLTHYDNNIRTYIFSSRLLGMDELTINDYSIFENKISALVGERNIYNGEDELVFAPTFAPQNNTAGEKTNQVFEFVIPKEFEAFRANFILPLKTKVLSATYTICNKNNNKCETQDYNVPTNHTGTFGINTKDIKGDLFDDYYFTNVKIKTDIIPVGYKASSTASLAWTMSTVYGTAKKGKKLSVKFKIYDANNPSVCNSYIGKIDNSHSIKRVGLYNGNINFYDIENIDTSQRKEITSVNAGEKFVIRGFLGPSNYPYSTLLNMYDTVIYLRQPKGLSLELNDLVLERCDHRFDSANCTPIILNKDSIEIIERENDILYKIETKVDIGTALTKLDMINTKIWVIRIKAPYFVNEDFKSTITNVFNVSDLLTITGKPFETSEEHDLLFHQNVNDTYDIDNNPSTNTIAQVGVTNITVSPKSGFILSSSIVKNNIEYAKYNENNSSSFADIFTSNNKEETDEFSHKISIINSTEESIKVGTKLYVPIAKKDYKYFYEYEGVKKYIQDEPFEWSSVFESIDSNDKYNVYVATLNTDNKDVNIKSLTYTVLNNNVKKEDIAVVMIETTKSISANESIDILVKQKPSTDQTNSHLSKNIYNPIYDINSSSYKGIIEGNKVGIKLYRPVISLDLYHDINGNNIKEINENYIMDDRITVEFLDSKSNIIKDAIKVSDNYTYYVDNKKLSLQKYSIRIRLNDSKYNFLNTINKEYIIENIDISDENALYKLEKGLIKYDLNFDVPDKIELYLGNTEKIKIRNIIPEFFELVSDSNPIELEYDDSYLNVNLSNYELEITSNIKTLEKEENKEIKITLKDKYGNLVTKVINVELLKKSPPNLEVEDIEIKIGDIIEFDKYIKAKNWTGNVIEIRLADDNGDNRNTFYNTNAEYIKDFNGYYRATKEGKYTIDYLVIEKLFGNYTVEECIKDYTNQDICLANKKTMRLNVISPYTVSTLDNIIIYILLFIASIVGLSFSIIIVIKNKKNR